MNKSLLVHKRAVKIINELQLKYIFCTSIYLVISLGKRSNCVIDKENPLVKGKDIHNRDTRIASMYQLADHPKKGLMSGNHLASHNHWQVPRPTTRRGEEPKGISRLKMYHLCFVPQQTPQKNINKRCY